MNKEDKFLKDLMRELPREKAPEGITQLIMQKIQPKPQFVVETPKLKFWETTAFYVLLAVIALEVYFLWTNNHYFTFENLRFLLRTAYAGSVRYFAIHSYSPLFTAFLVIGVLLYLFVKERIEYARYRFSL